MSSEPQPRAEMPAPRILMQSPEWIVLDKPAGWLSIPGRGSPHAPVLSTWVKERFPEALTLHRLDAGTSGVILFARGAEAHRKASLWFQNREMRKLYLCLAAGRAARPILRIQKPIEGAACSTQVEVLSQLAHCFHARVRPLSGKRHQIRIHLAGEGNPLLGDVRYGGPREIATSAGALEIPRVALHAASLELPSGERFEAALPEDFRGWLAKLGEAR